MQCLKERVVFEMSNRHSPSNVGMDDGTRTNVTEAFKDASLSCMLLSSHYV